MASTMLQNIFAFVALVSLGFLGVVFYRWWQDTQPKVVVKKKRHVQSKAALPPSPSKPVEKREPEANRMVRERKPKPEKTANTEFDEVLMRAKKQAEEMALRKQKELQALAEVQREKYRLQRAKTLAEKEAQREARKREMEEREREKEEKRVLAEQELKASMLAKQRRAEELAKKAIEAAEEKKKKIAKEEEMRREREVARRLAAEEKARLKAEEEERRKAEEEERLKAEEEERLKAEEEERLKAEEEERRKAEEEERSAKEIGLSHTGKATDMAHTSTRDANQANEITTAQPAMSLSANQGGAETPADNDMIGEKCVQGDVVEEAPEKVNAAAVSMDTATLADSHENPEASPMGKECNSQLEERVPIVLELEYDADCHVVAVGSLPELGAWMPEKGVPLNKNGAVYKTTVALPLGSEFEYKYVSFSENQATWEPGVNRQGKVEGAAVLSSKFNV